MIVITDSNILFSALISPNGVIAKILNERKNIQFLIPDYLLTEVNEHLCRLSKILNKTEKQLKKEVAELLKGTKTIFTKDISKENNEKAKKIANDIDIDDVPFIAFHLEYKHKIWSGDKELKQGLTAKGYGHFFISTQELKDRIYKK